MAKDLFFDWLDQAPTGVAGALVLVVRAGQEGIAVQNVRSRLTAHFVGEATVASNRGYSKTAALLLQNSLPTDKKARSGDLGELLAAEYLNARTPYRVPIFKLRWKSDRQTPLHGNDVIGIDTTIKPPIVLKGECKSRANLAPSTIKQAVEGLNSHEGRPNPSSLAFIAKRLYDLNRDDEAAVFTRLQTRRRMRPSRIVHLVFLLCGNDPSAALASVPPSTTIKRLTTAIRVRAHAKFIADVFAAPYGP